MAENKQHGRISHVGQLIGEAFENAVIKLIKSHLKKNHPAFILLRPDDGRKLLTLDMPGGIKRQLDTVVAPIDSDDPVALLETKWLKDGRHWSDKGAWILQLREVRKNYPTVRGAAAILAGYWNEGVRVLLRNEGGGIEMILVATDEEAYNSIQPYLDRALGEKTFTLNARQIRSRFPEQYVDVFDDFLVSLKETGELNKLAKQWFKFPRTDLDGNQTNGQELVRRALDFMLQPLPANPKINNFEITLEVETGNLIYRKFKDLEELLDFINQNVTDPAKILEEISPKPTIRQIGEQIGFYDIDEDDEDF
ncbi:MAG: hypothetical protein HFACDABA_00505 [Anaerolineales bacterium]|nr:hypothetical protein [Anaerolineales bacterium]